ncbi:MAG: bifunctional adenosylcobinamide kinase/adenosylcobinamide-phosphate guanylyltransferase [Alphaproteobacteria bacterium]|nr:MAG: bifunctional adenosylcobinamide kinase/adenosylcobinamide-phosphate guanylyltransferase [Alphaproteobacteria bacterium]
MSRGLPPVTLILGGARSGKSRYGEALAESRPGPCIYVATAHAGDDEMAARIARHRARRGARWTTVEEPVNLVAALRTHAVADHVVVVDCLTLWLSNVLAAGCDPAAESERLVAVLPELRAPVIFISNEVGQGIVPDNALARRFVDCAGCLHQDLAAAADAVVLMTAGLSLALKGALPDRASEPEGPPS